MSRSRSTPAPRWQTTICSHGRIEWSDEKLARLTAEHLKRLLENLGWQRIIGRLSAKEALDLARRIIARLPASAGSKRCLLSRTLMQLDAQAAADFQLFAAELRWRFGLRDVAAQRAATETRGESPPPDDAAPYLLAATDGLLASGVPIADMMSAASERDWSRDSRGRVRAQPARCYAEAHQTYEALIARLRSKGAPRD